MLPRTLAIGVLFLFMPALVRADAFDHYTNPILAKVPEAKAVEKITKLTPEMMVQHSRALPGVSGTFIVIKTNDDRWAKLLVLPGRQKISAQESVPIVLIDRYVTFREGEERRVHASGQNVRLFGDFRFNLDMGQVVPKEVSADLRVVVDKDDYFLEPVGKAEMYLVTKHLPEANPAKPAKLVVGAKFETRYFNGAYTLYDDGRRSGTLHLTVDDKGDVIGHYFSDNPEAKGAKYEVGGKVSNMPAHQVEFTITLPRTHQTFTGYLFTGDGRAITGSSVLEGRITGFYAVRIEDEAKK
jgi:hypothetical protein